MKFMPPHAKLAAAAILAIAFALPSGAQSADAAAQAAAPADSAQQTAPASIPTATPAGGSLHGVIKSGGDKNAIPLPGVSVTARNALTGDKYTTVTDATGAWAMLIPKDGRYVVRAELAAFAVGTKSVLLNATGRDATVDLGLDLASRVKDTGGEAIAGASALGITGRGTQALSLLGSVAGAISAGTGGGQATLPSASQADNGLDSVAVTGAAGSTSAAFNFEAARQSMEDQRSLERSANGGSGGGGMNMPGGMGFLFGGRPPGGGGGASAFRRFNASAIHGSFVYQLTNSALNARDFSVTGQPQPQPSYGTSRYGLVYSGPLIPKLLESTKDFLFLALIGNHGSSLFDESSNVPTADQRAGFFTSTAPLYDPYTGQPYAAGTAPDGSVQQQIPVCTSVLTQGCISPIAQALLPYIPLPNQTATTASDYNYRTIQQQHTNTDQVSARYVHNFGSGGGGPMPPWMQRNSNSKKLSQNINANFNFQHASEDEPSLFQAFGGKDQLYQYVLNVSHTMSKGNWNNTITAAMNRTDSESRNFFTETENVAGNAGIQGVGLTPFFYGLPTLQFSGYGGGSEQQPSSRVNEVLQLSENFGYLHKAHNWKFGGDVRRVFTNVIGGVQGTGSLTFSGFATQNPTTQSGGDGFADFLIAVPQQGTLQAPCAGAVPAGDCSIGSEQYKLRENEWSLYGQDTWHASANVTILYGLRYEYFSPYSEANDRIANLDPNSTFTNVAIVTPNATGPYNGKYPHSLIEPFRDGLSPRVGFAWKAAKNTVVRGGYGINFNTSVYGNFIQDLAYERPFALANNNTQSANASPASYFTTANALTDLGSNDCSSPPCITNTYAVAKDYRMGYVQGWNLDIQQTLIKGFLLNVGYNGSKGTHLDGLLSPNRIINVGASTPNAEPFDYEISHAQSNFNALAVRLRKRQQNGLGLGATYTYSHSIDDASSIGGTNPVVAQQPTNLLGDIGNSNFDQRHVLRGDITYELPFGPQAKHLNSGNWISHTLSGLQIYGNYTFATGTPLNPFYEATASEVSSGVTNSLRPDRLPGTSLAGGPSELAEFFNIAAFAAPCTLVGGTGPNTGACQPNTYHYGSAARNSIPGPGTRQFNASFSKYVGFGGTKSLEFRGTANNVFNVVQYNSVNTALDSPTAGRVSSADAMRNVQIVLRYRF